MYHGKRLQKADKTRRRCGKMGAILVSVLLLVGVTVSGTLAYLFDSTDPVKNTFTPSHAGTDITENFDGTVKKNVNAINKGDIDAYIRIRLVTYRVNKDNQIIGGTETIPDFAPGTNWVKYGDYYYYTLPVKPNEKPAADLIGDAGIQLKEYENGEKLVVEVIAESIQSVPEQAVKDAWGSGFSINQNGTLNVPKP